MFRFENITSAYLLIIIPIIILAFVYLQVWKKRKIANLGDPHLIDSLSPQKALTKPRIKFILRLLTLLLLTLALVNPQLGSKMEKVKRKGADVMIALDVSKSMEAQDISPSRIDKAKMIISKLVDQLAGDRLGLILYAGQAYVQVPMTSDYSAIKMFLSSINTDILSSQGTSISEVFKLSKSAFNSENEASQCIVVLSDGEDHEQGVEKALEELKPFNVTVHTIGIGSQKGGPIPMGGYQNFKKDRSGNVVITKLEESMLQNIALQTNGSYIKGTSVTQTVNHLMEQIKAFDQTEQDTKIITDYESQYYWIVVIALVFILAEFFLNNKQSKWWRKLNLFGNYE